MTKPTTFLCAACGKSSRLLGGVGLWVPKDGAPTEFHLCLPCTKLAEREDPEQFDARIRLRLEKVEGQA